MQDDLLIKLVEAVEAAGGELLPEPHHPYPIIYKIPRSGGRPPKHSELMSTGCGQETLLRVPYKKPDGSTGNVHLCAICDGAALFPRWGLNAEPDMKEPM